ncbi:hypothetical protein V7S43_014707 [Phytophthora oleae]|uniref:SDR family NAD(P)-dependent oxidoreductase n=1 Tax=Phytophthora oleae TaxID=2107226 RepID=A0ABD3F3E9_9STRA
MELRNVTALVAGGATGLGKAFADTLLSHGGKVIIMDPNAFELQRTAAILHAQYGVSRVCSLVQDTETPG